jgi:site-specific recombinase XerC
MTALAPHLSAYLREHLPRERAVSPHTVKTYANCFVLLVQFAADRLKRRPTDLEIEDLGTDMIMAFPTMSRTVAAAVFGPAMAGSPRSGPSSATSSIVFRPAWIRPFASDRSLTKKTDKALIDYLDRAEIKALLDPDPRTRLGTRDRAMLHLAYAGGLRVSELVTLQLRDFPDRSCPPCTSWARVGVNGSSRSGRTQFALRAWLAIRPDRKLPRYSSMPTGSP